MNQRLRLATLLRALPDGYAYKLIGQLVRGERRGCLPARIPFQGRVARLFRDLFPDQMARNGAGRCGARRGADVTRLVHSRA